MTLTAGGTALLLIGCQEAYRHGEQAVHGVDAALGRAAELLRRAREAGAPVVHVRHRAAGMGEDGCRFARATLPSPSEVIIDAARPDAFAGTDLEPLLRGAGVAHVVLAGFLTHLSITASARTASRRGFAVTAVASATGTRSAPGTFCPPGRLHRAVLESFAVGLGEVVPDVDSVVWPAVAFHDT